MSDLWDWTNRTKTTREIVLDVWHEEKRLTADNPNAEQHSAELWDKLEKANSARLIKPPSMWRRIKRDTLEIGRKKPTHCLIGTCKI